MLRFKNGHFKIMQIADTQESTKISPDTLNLISAVLDREQPDFVVFSGDQVKGYSAAVKRGGNVCVEQMINKLTEPIVSRDIPFSVTFGNHDTQSGVGKQEQMSIYEKAGTFTKGNRHSEEDVGTSSFVVFSENGEKEVFQLLLIDSQGSLDLGGYKPVTPEQIEWYRSMRDGALKRNGEYLPALVIQHIPVPEFYDTLVKVPKGTKGAVQAFRTHKNEYYVLPDHALENGGFMHESPAIPDENTGEFKAMCECGDVMGIFVGHDHINSYVTKLNGVDLGYTQGCGFNVYGPGRKRGVRIFDFCEENPREYKTYTVTSEDIGQVLHGSDVFRKVMDSMPTSAEQVKPLIKGACIAAGVSAAAGIVYAIKRRK